MIAVMFGLGMGLIGLIAVIFSIVAIVDAARSALSVQAKVLWILCIVFLPPIGMILYFLIGRKK